MAITITEETLRLLVCPVSGQPFRFATEEETREAFPDEAPISAGLITEDGSRIYPVRDEMPVLIPDESKELRR